MATSKEKSGPAAEDKRVKLVSFVPYINFTLPYWISMTVIRSSIGYAVIGLLSVLNETQLLGVLARLYYQQTFSWYTHTVCLRRGLHYRSSHTQ